MATVRILCCNCWHFVKQHLTSGCVMTDFRFRSRDLGLMAIAFGISEGQMEFCSKRITSSNNSSCPINIHEPFAPNPEMRSHSHIRQTGRTQFRCGGDLRTGGNFNLYAFMCAVLICVATKRRRERGKIGYFRCVFTNSKLSQDSITEDSVTL